MDFLESLSDADDNLKDAVLKATEELYALMDLPFGKIEKKMFNSFTLAHKMGLSFQQEYQLLQLSSEKVRLQFLLDHLRHTVDLLQQLNHTRELIEMNGHFRNFDPLDFKDFKLQ